TVIWGMSAARIGYSSPVWGDRFTFSLVALGLAMFLMPIFRSRLRRILSKTNWWGFPTLVCGDDSAVLSVYQWLCDNRRLGLRPIGIITDPHGLEVDEDSPGYI